MFRLPDNAAIYNEAVPIEFTRALLTHARAQYGDVEAMLREARFPFDPLRQHVQTAYVSREQYSRLCQVLFRYLGDESGEPAFLMSSGSTMTIKKRVLVISRKETTQTTSTMCCAVWPCG